MTAQALARADAYDERRLCAPRSLGAGLTPDERRTFEREGYLLVEDALSPDQLRVYLQLHERIYREEAELGRLTPAGGRSHRAGAMHSFAFVLRDSAYLELLDLDTTFPIVADILGWNIYMYHCHIDQQPPLRGLVEPVWAWHQDGGRQNVEIETEPTRPRLSVKVALFLSDISQPGRGNLKVVPGSHRRNRLARPRDGAPLVDPRGAIELCVPPGAAVIFDRRLWHSRSDNRSRVTRKVLFLGYTYRWIRARDDYPIDWSAEPFVNMSPLRKQLLGGGEDAMSFWGLRNDTPLKEMLSGP